MGLAARAEANLLQLLTGDDFGATSVEDLRELEPDNIDTLKATLPMLKRKAFVEAIAALKASLILPPYTHMRARIRTCVRNNTHTHVHT